mmetsp:Transcript_19428/g.74594  ORF Transcript_19428/g.74594 Transcript_19428/m.74594 type:complete len:264 (+) Transcript_19428:568-1359(+)
MSSKRNFPTKSFLPFSAQSSARMRSLFLRKACFFLFFSSLACFFSSFQASCRRRCSSSHCSCRSAYSLFFAAFSSVRFSCFSRAQMAAFCLPSSAFLAMLARTVSLMAAARCSLSAASAAAFLFLACALFFFRFALSLAAMRRSSAAIAAASAGAGAGGGSSSCRNELKWDEPTLYGSSLSPYELSLQQSLPTLLRRLAVSSDQRERRAAASCCSCSSSRCALRAFTSSARRMAASFSFSADVSVGGSLCASDTTVLAAVWSA